MTKPTFKTLQAMEKNKNNPRIVIGASELISMRFPESDRFKLRSHKLLHYLVNNAGEELLEDKYHSIPMGSVDFLRHTTVEEAVRFAQDLSDIRVSITQQREEDEVTIVEPLFASIEQDHNLEHGSIRYKFSDVTKAIMRESSRWAELRRKIIGSLRSVPALRIYEFVALNGFPNKINTKLFSLQELRELMALPADKHMKWYDFRRHILEPALVQINKFEDVKVWSDAVKKGRSVSGVLLSWEKKIQIPLTFSKQEGFPPSGSISLAKDKVWHNLALKHGRGQDTDMIALAFRAWCSGKEIKLTDPSIEKKFITFCQKHSVV